jgi:hypothetical protein
MLLHRRPQQLWAHMGPSPILRFCFLHRSARRLELEVDDIQKVLMSSSQVENAVRLVQDRKQEKRKPPVKREFENREVGIRTSWHVTVQSHQRLMIRPRFS